MHITTEEIVSFLIALDFLTDSDKNNACLKCKTFCTIVYFIRIMYCYGIYIAF